MLGIFVRDFLAKISGHDYCVLRNYEGLPDRRGNNLDLLVAPESLEAAERAIADGAGFHGRILWDATKPNGQPRRKLDTTRAEREFDFRSPTTFEEGLRRMVEWYRLETAVAVPVLLNS